MSVRLYLTIAAIVAILYALAFLIVPIQASLFFSSFAEARAVLYLRFCGAAVLAWGLIVWFARDFQDWHAVRSVLIGSMVGLIVNIIITIWANPGRVAECQRLGKRNRAGVASCRRGLSG